MNKSFDWQHFKNLAAGFVVDDLTPEEEVEFRQLLEQNPELIAEVEDLQEVLRQVVDGFTEVEVPDHLLANILEQVESSSAQVAVDALPIDGQLPVTAPPNPALFSLSWRKITIGIAAISLLVLGFDNWRLRNNFGIVTAENQTLRKKLDIITAENNKLRDNTQQALAVKNLLQNSQTRLFSLQPAKSSNIIAKPGSGRMIINLQQQKAIMLFQNLPEPPQGYVYMLWTVVASEKIPCGKVKPYSWGNATYELTFTNQMYQEFISPQFSGLLVTLETDPNVSRPTGTVVMQSTQI